MEKKQETKEQHTQPDASPRYEVENVAGKFQYFVHSAR